MTLFPTVIADLRNGRAPHPLRFTRSSIGLSFHTDGLAQVPWDTLRTTRGSYRRVEGALLERRSVNLLVNSEAIGDTPWVRLGVDAKKIQSGRDGPVPGAMPVMISDTASNGPHVLFQDVSPVSEQATCTGFFKACDLSKIQLLINDAGSNNIHAGFDLTAGRAVVVGQEGAASATGAKIEGFGNGWWRCSLGGNLPPATTYRFHVFLVDADRVEYEGKASSIYVWGLQVEPGLTPTSFIPTLPDQTQARETEDLVLRLTEPSQLLKSVIVELQQGKRDYAAPILQFDDAQAKSEVSIWQDGDDVFVYVSVEGGVTIQQARLPVTERLTRRIGVRFPEHAVELWASGARLLQIPIAKGLAYSWCYIGGGNGSARWDGVIAAVEGYCDLPGASKMQVATS